MSKQDDWTRTLHELGALMHEGMDVEEARDIFESIHGFRPDTGRPSPKPTQEKRPWWKIWA